MFSVKKTILFLIVFYSNSLWNKFNMCFTIYINIYNLMSNIYNLICP